MFKDWYDIRNKETTINPLNELLWLNVNIQINNKELLWHTWYKAGICRIKDLLNDDKEILFYLDINRKSKAGPGVRPHCTPGNGNS